MKLHLYTQAESECQAFGNLDKPDLYFEYYSDVYPARKGSMVPFQLRVLMAELPLYLGKTQESLDRLYYLHAVILKILGHLESGLAEVGSMIQLSDKSRSASRQVWESREVQILYSVGNCLLNIKDYTSALDIYERLLKKDENNKQTLSCGMGRIYLQMGDIRQAEKCFKNAEKLTVISTDVHIQSRNQMNKGFLALGQNQFKEAQQYFREAVQVDPENAVAINNMAVTSLYTGKLKEALTTLEQLIHSDPRKYLQESILFNLCTLYELESSHAVQKKQKLLDLVSQHKGNGFNVACLKMG